MHAALSSTSLHRAVGLVALLNLTWFSIEFAVAHIIGSVALFADSVDFLEDTSLNLLILAALGWTAARRARLGMALAGLLLLPTLATLCTAWAKLNLPLPPAPWKLAVTAGGALAINLCCARLLTGVRHHRGSLTRAAFLSARNDAIADLAIFAAAIISATLWPSAWPDLIVGLGIAALNADAAREVWNAARTEQRAATA